MVLAWVKIQTPRRITFIEEETSPKGAAGFTMRFEFTTKVQGDIKEKLPMPFLRHVVQEAITQDREHGPDMAYSEVKIKRLRHRMDVKFLKYSALHPLSAGYEEDREEEMDGFLLE